MGLSKMLRSASARPTWLDCQRSAVLLPHFRSVLTAKDLKFRSTLLLCLDCQDLMFRFRTSALPWLPKIWSSASALSLLPKIWSSTSALSFCIDCQKCEVPLPHFRSALTATYVKFCFRTSAEGPCVKAILAVLFSTVPSWRWPLLGLF